MSVPDPATTDWVPLYGGAIDLKYLGDYVPATQYKDGDIVMYQGAPWLAVKETTSPPDPFPIELDTMRYKGDHVVGNSYVDGDIVVSGGIVYFCVLPTSTTPNPTPWGAT